jgi:hypothetical protein
MELLMWQVGNTKTIAQAPKFLRACFAADVLDGKFALSPTLDLVAAVFKVSSSSVSRARRLNPEQRAAVRRGDRPLVIPRTAPAPVPIPSESPQQRLDGIVAEIGVERTLDLLAKHNGGCPASWQFPLPLSDAA